MDLKQTHDPHFFKIIDPHIVQNGLLMIPNEFVKKYGKDLSDHVYLNVPNGDSWLVRLISANGKVYLEDGWREFAEHYSIGLYHFLVFRYQATFHFHVLIFDRVSASEIEYPSLHKDPIDVNAESQVKIKGIVDELPPLSKKKKYGSMPYSCRTQNIKIGIKSKGMVSDAEKESALESAKAFTSTNLSFMVPMRRSFMKCNVVVPKSFRNACLSFKTMNKWVNLTLVVSGRSWTVKYDGNEKQLGKGWGAFARDNGLKVGDVCVFELMKCSEYSSMFTYFEQEIENETYYSSCL